MNTLEARPLAGERQVMMLAHPNPFVRALVGWAVGLVLFAAVWVVGYLWSLRARRVRGLREVRLSRAEVACLAIALALLAWAAWTEASTIVAGAV